MELDEVDPLKWAALEAATDDYIADQASRLDAAAAALTLVRARVGQRRGVAWRVCAGAECYAPAHYTTTPAPQQELAAVQQRREERQQGEALRLGVRRKLVVVRAPLLASVAARGSDADDAAALVLARLPDCVGVVELPGMEGQGVEAVEIETGARPGGSAPQRPPPQRASAPSSPGAAPMVAPVVSADDEASGLSAYISSWFTSPTKAPGASPTTTTTPQQQQPDPQLPAHPPPVKTGVLASHPLSVPVDEGARAGPRGSPAGAAELQALLDPLLAATGVLHLALQPAAQGLVLRWEQRLEAVAEPSECVWGGGGGQGAR